MQDELLSLQAQWDPACTILFITHDLDEALKLGDRIAILKEGRVAQVGTPTEILTDPADDYVRSFVQNVDRTRALPASAVMRAPTDAERARPDAPSVAPRTPLADVLPLLLDADEPILVRDGDRVAGVVDPDAVLDEVLRNADTEGLSPSSEAEPSAEAA
jgi:glycine betaine/proline transport system ATP-binding protein